MSDELNQNRQLHCDAQSTVTDQCGYLETDITGIIFYPQELKVNLFINELYIYDRNIRARYLPPPSVLNGAGVILSVSNRGIYDTQNETTNGSSQLKLITGLNRYSFTSNIHTRWNQSTQLRNAQVNYSGRNTEFSAGIMPFDNGTSLVVPVRLVGMRFGTSLKHRTNKQSLLANDVTVQTNGGAVVEILRNGVVLDIQRVKQGISHLDTQSFPQGNYGLTLRITENGTTREEARFFTNSSTLPPLGIPQWSISIGTPISSVTTTRFIPEQHDYVSVFTNLKKRINTNLAARVQLAANENIQYAELGLQYQTAYLNSEFALLHSTKNDTGFSLQASVRKGNWSLSTSFQHLNVSVTSEPELEAYYDSFPKSFQRARISSNIRFNNLKLGTRGYYRKQDNEPDNYHAGPTVDWTISRKNKSKLSLFARAEFGNTGNSSYIGIRWQSLGKVNISNTTAFNYQQPNNDGLAIARSTIDTNLSHFNNTSSNIRNQFNVGIRHQRTDQENELANETSLRSSETGFRASVRSSSEWADTYLDASKNYNQADNIIGSLSSSLVVGREKAVIVASAGEAGVFVDISGDSSTDFDLVANGRIQKGISSNRSTYVPLDNFEVHDIGIRPISANDIEYEHFEDRIVTYPGNIAHLTRKVYTVVIAVGQLVDENRHPLPNAVMHSRTHLGTTDVDGFFQFDLSGENIINVTKEDASECTVSIENSNRVSERHADFINLGTLTCV